jgi:outer membrane protein assembly factor BamB
MRETTRLQKHIALALIALLSAASISAQGKASSRSGIALERTRDGASPSSRIKPLVLPDGRMVVSVPDTVYMLGPNADSLWKDATAGETFTSEPAYNAGLNEIAVVGYDLLFARLDANTGKLKWKAKTVGRAVFSSVEANGKGYLVVVDMPGYCENGPHNSGVSVPDQLEYWTDSEDQGWQIDFARNAELAVSGSRIYSLTRGNHGIRLRELNGPAAREKKP